MNQWISCTVKCLVSKLKIRIGMHLISSIGHQKHAHIYKLDEENFHKHIVVIMGIISCKVNSCYYSVFTFILIDMAALLSESVLGHTNSPCINTVLIFDALCYWRSRLIQWKLNFSSNMTEDKSYLRMWSWGKWRSTELILHSMVRCVHKILSPLFNIWHTIIKYLLFSR